MVRGGFRNHKVSSLEQNLDIVYSFIHSFNKYLLSIYHMPDIMLDNGDHIESSTLDLHPSFGKPYLVNCYPPSI